MDIVEDKYHLQKHESGDRIIVPTTESGEIVRGISSKEKILDVINRVDFITTIKAPNDKIRKELYEDALKEFDEVGWIKIIKSSYLRKQDGRLMQGETEYAEMAKSYLHGEISVVMGIPVNKVEGYISTAVSNDKWQLSDIQFKF